MPRVRSYERSSRLTPKQRALARKLTVAPRIEAKTPYGPFTPPTAENVAMMPHFGRMEIEERIGTTIPSPPEHPNGSFTNFEKEDAEMLAQELEKLKGKPVILTGGGGGGAQLWFLQDVKVVPWHEPLRGPDGEILRKKDIGEDVWYQPDLSKPIKYYSVKMYLDNPFAQKGSIFRHDAPTFDPWYGSWRITALKGYGQEDLRKTYPAGWE